MSSVTCLAIAAAAEPLVDFNRDVRPILSDNCFHCHGPDQATREAELRLDTVDGLQRKVGDHSVVVPSKPTESELLRRLISTDPDEQMPPPKSGKKLTNQQVEVIRRWIQQGAVWRPHWSFVAPVRPKLPDVSRSDWCRNPIDRFVLAKLDREGLKPSPRADRSTLLRRVSFDLTGLPPSVEELQSFLADTSEDAFERAVDRLLKSPRCAEKLAYRWLDAARFADTSGYQSDGYREMWRWRDWVIDALHKNMPFDQFTIEQLAGDMLPNPTLDQRIATAFNRNHRMNSEGGIVPEEFQVEYVVDRADTTMTVWQGLTFGCARCHSHKYDPISQHDYYRVFAFFNNIPEFGRAIKEGPTPPYLRAPTAEQQVELSSRESKLTAARRRMADIEQTLPEQLAAWERDVPHSPDSKAPVALPLEEDALVVHLKLDRALTNSPAVAETELQRSATTVPVAGARTEALDLYPPKLVAYVPLKLDTPGTSAKNISDNLPAIEPRFAAGVRGEAVVLDGQHYIDAGPIGKLGYFERFTIAGWIKQEQRAAGTIVSKMEHFAQGSGYSFDVTETGKLQFNMVKRWLDDSLRVESLDSIPLGRWVHVCVTYDGTRVAAGLQFYVNGRKVPLKANLDFINQSFDVLEPLRVGSGNARFKGEIDDLRIYRRWLPEHDVRVVAEPSSVPNILMVKSADRSESQRHKLRHYFLEVAGPSATQAAWRELNALEREHVQYLTTLPTVMVMQEQPGLRATHVLQRGAYDRPGDRVQAGVPTALPPLSAGVEPDRLAFARWLVGQENPLTARVIVNRYWRDLFGTGLVKTTEDFGSQGEAPSHPELLDWLAVEFRDGPEASDKSATTSRAWDIKGLLKLIVMSNTYQQRSATTVTAQAADPENRWLARGGRIRLTAEMVRDQALFVSGLLSEKQGGPSVKPYQPDGLWAELATDTLYEQSHGPDLYRRSLYVYWKRTVPFPMLMNFDTSGREMCEVRQFRTNTPLQALNLLNDITFVEAARVLAERLLSEHSNDEDRLANAFLRVVSREPSPAESTLLLKSLQRHRAYFERHADRAQQLLQVGESQKRTPMKPSSKGEVTPSEVAAWTTLCSALLNLDEAVTKE